MDNNSGKLFWIENDFVNSGNRAAIHDLEKMNMVIL